MKNILLASVAILFVGTSASFAAMPVFDLHSGVTNTAPSDLLLLASGGDDDRGGDDRGRDDDRGGDDRDGDDDSDGDDDRGGDDRSGHRSSSSNDSNDDNNVSGSNRRKARVPGGSGCDDAGDIAEHAACRN